MADDFNWNHFRKVQVQVQVLYISMVGYIKGEISKWGLIIPPYYRDAVYSAQPLGLISTSFRRNISVISTSEIGEITMAPGDGLK
jgi:hypothetical protein